MKTCLLRNPIFHIVKRTNITASLSSLMTLGLFVVGFICFTFDLNASSAKSQTTIVLINGNAVLVELGSKGEIFKEYINVPDYFTSYRSHESLVERSIKRVKGLSKVHKTFDSEHFLSSESKHKNVISPKFNIELNSTVSDTDASEENAFQNNSVIPMYAQSMVNRTPMSFIQTFGLFSSELILHNLHSPILPKAVLRREEKT